MSKILIVEDDADLVETYTDLLEAKGYETISAGNTADAIQLAAEIVPCVIILDLSLPGGSGICVIDFVRSCQALEHTRIIVVTGHSEMINLGPLLRADLIMNKPVSNEQLLMLIDRFLSTPAAVDQPQQVDDLETKTAAQTAKSNQPKIERKTNDQSSNRRG